MSGRETRATSEEAVRGAERRGRRTQKLCPEYPPVAMPPGDVDQFQSARNELTMS
jgi:hypothetical protein